MKKIITICQFLLIGISAFTRNTAFQNTQDSLKPDHSVFLIGDLGESALVNFNLQALKSQMDEAGEKGSVIFLGNTISKTYSETELEEIDGGDQSLVQLLELVRNFKGELIFIPGEKEWNHGQKHGWEALLHLETFVEDYLGRGDVFLPSGGCPGPVEIDLTNEIVLIIVDSQWWLHLGEKPGEECGFENTSDFLILLNDAIRRNEHKKIILAAHHPIYSAGKHGGNFPFPDPVALYRKLIGTAQDFAYPFYKQMRYMAKQLGKGHDNIISVAAHDNSLQFARKGGSFFVVSGSGSKTDYVSPKKMDVAIREVGFSKLNFYSNNEVWLEFWTVGENGNKQAHLAYKEKLYTKKVLSDKERRAKYEHINFSDSTIYVAASKQYDTDSKCKRKLLGNNYRKEWSTPVKVPVFDIGTEKGGLEIVKRGGGQQTRSLRLEAKDGKQYVLRSVEKYTEKAIPEALRGSFAADIVQDGISESHPYAALAIPVMAKAAGIYHTHPKIVYVPDDPRLGIYQEDFKNELFLYEERPKGNMSDSDNFGNSKKILSTEKLIEERYKDSDVRVDESMVLRARLFDILVNDWDRHDDQWRWASFKKDGKTIVQPIPRDRDQVFFYTDGAIPWLVRRKWAMPKFQVFDTVVENVTGLGFNSRYFDRYFLKSKNESDWLAMAKELQERLTDEQITDAVKQLPSEIYQLSGQEIIQKLKARRDQLPGLAKEFYRYLAKQADITGSNDRELFTANWNPKGDVSIQVHKLGKKGNAKEKLYERTFLKNETDEVRLYGLGDKDKFEFTGAKTRGVKVRAIGGKGKDKFTISNTRKQNLVLYDKPKSSIKGDGAFRNRMQKDPSVNAYNRNAFQYDVLSPNVNLNYVSDDGLQLGLGAALKTQGFRKEPYASLHKLLVNYAFAYPSVEFRYSAEVIGIIRKIDFVSNLSYNTPNFQGYYYGLGNETKNPKTHDDEYNRIRMGQFYVHPQLRMRLRKEHQVLLGAFYQQLELKATPGRFVTDFTNPNNDLNPQTDFDTRKYTGISASYIWDTRNSEILPTRGIFWTSKWRFFKGLEKEDHNFQRLETDLRLYTSFGRPQRSILAVRFGAAHNSSGYSFYQANKLGLKTNLRGYRQDRFAGDDMVYQNTDFRFRLARFRTYLLGGEMGIVAFNDFGRVWLNGEKSDKWHHGYGTGLWLSPYKLMVLTANYSRSSEDSVFSLQFSYLF